MAVPITAFYASLLAVLLIYLTIMVIKQRRQSKVGLGDGGKKHLLQEMRAHGNFTENVPFALLLMMMAELNGAHHILLHVCGWALIAARVLHAFGIRHHAGLSWQRFVGVVTTFFIYAALIVANLLPMYIK